MYELPITVEVAGKSYKIRNGADYRTIIGVISLCEDPELTKEERTVSALIVFYEDINELEDIFEVFGENTKDAMDAMLKFISYDYDDDLASSAKVKLIDWVQDENLIIAGINSVARTEVRALEYLHWWTFLSYYMSIGESALSTVVSIRNKIAKGKKLEKYEKEFRRENPSYFRWKNQEIEERNFIESIWNKDK